MTDFTRLSVLDITEALGYMLKDIEEFEALGMPCNPHTLTFQRTFNLVACTTWLRDREYAIGLENGRFLGHQEAADIAADKAARAVQVTVEYGGQLVPATVLESDIICAFKASVGLQASDERVFQ